MANREQVKLLKRNVWAWNRWREKHPRLVPDLSKANLTGMALAGANLSNADLSQAKLYEANLWSAHLGGADLSCADLCFANLLGVLLKRTEFGRAAVGNTIFADVDLSE